MKDENKQNTTKRLQALTETLIPNKESFKPLDGPLVYNISRIYWESGYEESFDDGEVPLSIAHGFGMSIGVNGGNRRDGTNNELSAHAGWHLRVKLPESEGRTNSFTLATEQIIFLSSRKEFVFLSGGSPRHYLQRLLSKNCLNEIFNDACVNQTRERPKNVGGIVNRLLEGKEFIESTQRAARMVRTYNSLRASYSLKDRRFERYCERHADEISEHRENYGEDNFIHAPELIDCLKEFKEALSNA